MGKTVTYYLHVRDIMRGYSLALNYETKKELAIAYNRYLHDDDYEILSMHSTTIETDVIDLEEIY